MSYDDGTAAAAWALSSGISAGSDTGDKVEETRTADEEVAVGQRWCNLISCLGSRVTIDETGEVFEVAEGAITFLAIIYWKEGIFKFPGGSGNRFSWPVTAVPLYLE